MLDHQHKGLIPLLHMVTLVGAVKEDYPPCQDADSLEQHNKELTLLQHAPR